MKHKKVFRKEDSTTGTINEEGEDEEYEASNSTTTIPQDMIMQFKAFEE